MKYFSKKNVLALVMAMSLTMTCFSTAFGKDNSSTTSVKTKSTTSTPQKPPISKTALDKLVSAGTITADQETKIINALTNTTAGYPDVLKSLVTAGTITQAQSTAVDQAMKPSGAPPSAGQSTSTTSSGTNSTPPSGNPPSGGAPGGSSSSTVVTKATYLQKGKAVSKSSQKLSATKANESVVAVTDGGTLRLVKSTLNKIGNTTSEDNSNFYGQNAVVLAKSKSKITIKDTTITSSSEGSNGVFATGEGSKISVSNVKIKTTKNSSRGLDATMKGTVIADNVEIATSGAHCAALATDRGNGTVTVTKVTATTAGEGSPGIYSTGTISATNSKFTATGSEAAVIEGRNSINLKNTVISGAKRNGVMLYQSFSGDAEVGTTTFNMTGGSITSQAGSMFYVTNTSAVININNVNLVNSTTALLTASADRWGTSGSNGGVVKLNANAQVLSGSITCDNVSTANITLTNGSELTSVINKDNTAKSIALSLDKTSKWIVTGTSYITELTDADASLSNIVDNGNTIYYNASASANSWLNGKTITLSGGGTLTPAK